MHSPSRYQQPEQGRGIQADLFALIMVMVVLLGPSFVAHADANVSDPLLEVELVEGEIIGFTLEDLRALPMTGFETSTVWTEHVDKYTGVLLIDLLQHIGVGAEVGSVGVHAIDGYSAVIDFGLVSEQAPLLSFLRNGDPMSVRNQGPIWLIFPYDDDPRFRTESVYAMSVWQVQRLKVQ